jgi:hypothetical protein
MATAAKCWPASAAASPARASDDPRAGAGGRNREGATRSRRRPCWPGNAINPNHPSPAQIPDALPTRPTGLGRARRCPRRYLCTHYPLDYTVPPRPYNIVHSAFLAPLVSQRARRATRYLSFTTPMDRPTTPGGARYGRPPAYDDDQDDDASLLPRHAGTTMRLLTNVDDSHGYNMA